ncbi:MAG: hypothetical protein PUK59_02980 [Actinomycetaceae bacterium]|nr:hypothetical protein [Actinomycetaceae bacterium]MDY5855325.1 hypothetical protein [Arcanobacterium sp.]
MKMSSQEKISARRAKGLTAHEPTQKPAPGVSHRRHAFIIVGITLIAAIAVLVAWRMTVKNPATVGLDISGYSVNEAEFAYALDTVRNDVIQATAEKGSSISGQYWASTDPDSPTAKAVDQAIDVLRHRYAVYEMATESRIIDSPSWEALTQRMNAENSAREQKISSGEVVYGMPNFTLATYIDSEMRTMKEAYTADSSNPGMNPSEEDIRRYYDEHDWTVSDDRTRAALDEVRANVVQEYRYEHYDQLVAQRVKAQSVSIDLPQLRSFASGYLSLEREPK